MGGRRLGVLDPLLGKISEPAGLLRALFDSARGLRRNRRDWEADLSFMASPFFWTSFAWLRIPEILYYTSSKVIFN